MSEKMLPCPVCGGENLGNPTQNSAQKELGFYYVWCCDCGTCGPWEESSEIAVYSWNSMPRTRALRWTKEPPTTPGWYWVRFDKEEVRMLEFRGRGLKTIQKITEWEYSGPIPEPKEK